MRKFTFRLESLLKIYINREENVKREIVIWTEKLKKTRNSLLTLTEMHIKALRGLVESQKGKISVHQLISNHEFCLVLKNNIEQKQKEVMDLEKILENKKNELLELHKQRKILEKLKERQLTNYVAEELKTIQNELDEIAGNSFISQ